MVAPLDAAKAESGGGCLEAIEVAPVTARPLKKNTTALTVRKNSTKILHTNTNKIARFLSQTVPLTIVTEHEKSTAAEARTA